MNQTILVALIGASGIIVGAILTFLASTIAAQQKIKEINIAYKQKLDETYLANARMHIDTVYLPINIGLTNLAADYRKFKSHYQTFYQPTLFSVLDELSAERERQEWEEKNEEIKEEFRQACREFLEKISELTSQGKDAYLIVKLDEQLQSFTDFLEDSMDADVPVIEPKAAIRFHIPDHIQYRFWHILKHLSRPPRRRVRTYATVNLLVPAPRKGLSVHNRFKLLREVNLPYDKTIEGKVLEAPIASSLFNDRFLSDMRELKSIIKEVTLGTIITVPVSWTG